MAKKNKNKLSNEEGQIPLVFDLLRGRLSVNDKRVWVQAMYCILMIAFWTFIVLHIGSWTLVIPGLSNLESLGVDLLDLRQSYNPRFLGNLVRHVY